MSCADAGVEANAPTLDAPGSKGLPPLMQRRPGVPQLHVLWDLESVKPFIHQHRTGPVSGARDVEPQQSQPSSGSGSHVSRLTAAGLPGVASSPDLVGALDRLSRILKHYGTVHAVHLFLRESTLGKAPVLRRQVKQLCTWVDLQDEDLTEEQPGGQHAAAGVAADAPGLRAEALNPAAGTQGVIKDNSVTSGGDGLWRISPSGAPKASHAQRRLSAGLLESGDVHDCPMCRSAFANRLELLRHFVRAHQGPLMTATAADTRTHIMWTRGRAVGLPVAAPADLRAGAATAAGPSPPDGTVVEKVMVRPEEFAYARELLMRGRFMDELLASAPVTVHSTNPGAVTSPDPTGNALLGPTQWDSAQPRHVNAGKAGAGDSSKRSTNALGAGGVAILRRGLHLHLIPGGQPAEMAGEALRNVADALAAEQPQGSITSSPLPGRLGGRSSANKARDHKAASPTQDKADADDATVPCICVVSDAKGLDELLAGLRKRDILVMAVTRVTRVPSADVSLRWWAVQGGEYRLAAGNLRQRPMV
ncbi:hypothetical protein Vretifemale_1272 [Volvox reticuliferus]|uniref:C2H2-type domain-containing protein n=1 Tax=Volvox reticuliferus TaxID=1737510 RepID=A0A8J4C398_9CHLO|nr:hypothetical protein Vretifemale_1272 [Volvox reticuliferus]